MFMLTKRHHREASVNGVAKAWDVDLCQADAHELTTGRPMNNALVVDWQAEAHRQFRIDATVDRASVNECANAGGVWVWRAATLSRRPTRVEADIDADSGAVND